eukprot:3940837-Rhodomonas_salina.6
MPRTMMLLPEPADPVSGLCDPHCLHLQGAESTSNDGPFRTACAVCAVVLIHFRSSISAHCHSSCGSQYA